MMRKWWCEEDQWHPLRLSQLVWKVLLSGVKWGTSPDTSSQNCIFVSMWGYPICPEGERNMTEWFTHWKTTSTATANSWVETWSVIVPAFLCGLIVTIMLLWELLYTAILTLRRNWYFHIDASINLLQLLVASLSSRSSQCCQHCWHDVPEVAFDPLNSTSPKPKPTTRVYWCPSWTMNVRQFHTRGTEANSSRNNVGWNGVRDFFSYLWCPEN